jgi:ribosomal protein S18 acetylase RimI-like enzyme
MDVAVRAYRPEDLPEMVRIWNRVVEDGIAFPQENPLTVPEASAFFAAQSFAGVALGEGRLFGLYILHPNNVGRCGHIANCSYAVDGAARGLGIGEKLVLHSLETAREMGFRIMQFNAVVKTNLGALCLYEKLGFTRLGVIPGGFRMDDGYEDIVPMYRIL